MAFLVPRRVLLTVVTAIAATLAAPAAAAPAASDWTRTDAGDVRLVSAVAGTAGLETAPLGLEFRLADGWKVYWRSAGEVGYPPEVDWSGSDRKSTRLNSSH